MKLKTTPPIHCEGCRYLRRDNIPWCLQFDRAAWKVCDHCKVAHGKELKVRGPLLELYYRVMKKMRLNHSKSRHHKER